MTSYNGFKKVGGFSTKKTQSGEEVKGVADVNVTKYRSERSGMTVVVVDTDGPLVHGNFAIATEAHDDDGCPHTLEHLVFMGSEQFPYKGVLDCLANRCLADGTNAWTATDHTCYTVSTAGSEGFLNLLPIYLDHILRPTITESAFNTEVHHITGEGEDAGVVYCEMSNHENSEQSLVERALVNNLFKGTGYCADTGGRLPNLRSLTVEKVRNYHRDFYRPQNLCLIVTGKIDHAQLFEVLNSFETRLLGSPKNESTTNVRPWTSPIPEFSQTVVTQVEFPTDDEETGSASIAWRTTTFDDFEQQTALDILFEYLTKGALSPLQQQLVEVEEPYCSDVSFEISVYTQGSVSLEFDGVPTEVLDELIPKKVFSILSATLKEGLDLKRIQTIIEREKQSTIQEIENDPHNAFVQDIIEEFLYGNKESDFFEVLNWLPRYDSLMKKPLSFWHDLLRTYIEKPYVAVKAKPSKKLGDKLAKEEKERIAKQVKDLGKTALEGLGERLKADIAKNETPIPPDMLQFIQLPDVSKLHFFSVSTVRTTEDATRSNSLLAQRILQGEDAQGARLPFEIEFDHIPSAFVKISVVIDTTDLPDRYRPYLELYRNLIFEVPLVRNGVEIDHEEVVRQIEQETVETSCSIGFGEESPFKVGPFSQLVWLSIRSEARRYEKTVQWIKEFLYNTKFTSPRLKVGAKRLLKDVSDVKRSGSTMAQELLANQILDKTKSNRSTVGVFSQHKFLKSKKDFKALQKEFAEFQQALTQKSRLRFHVVGDILAIDDPLKPFKIQFLDSGTPVEKATALTKSYSSSHLVSPLQGGGVVGGISSVEIGFLQVCNRGPSDHSDPDLPSIHLATEYLTCLEGPFWKKIRGLGLSYGYGIVTSVEFGQLLFYLYRSQDVVKAYEQAKNIIAELISKKVDLDPHLLVAARGSAIYSVVSEQGTMTAAATTRFLNYLKGLALDHFKEYLKHLSEVTNEDVERALKQYVGAIVGVDSSSANKSVLAITCNPSKSKDFAEGFKHHGITLETLRVEKMFSK